MYFKQGVYVEKELVTATSGGTLTLTAASETYQIFTGSTTHTLKLPDATTLSNGRRFEVVNNSTGAITVQNNSGSTIGTVSASSSVIFRLSDNSTSNGSFDVTAASSGGTGLTGVESNQLGTLSSVSNSTTSRYLKLNPEEVGADVWTSKGGLPVASQALGTFISNGYLYSVGGLSGSAIANTQRYSDDNNYWIARSNIGTARYGEAALLGGLISGGSNGSNLATSEQYNDSLDSWSAKASNNNARSFMTGFNLGGSGYIVGGSSTTTVELYDSVNNVWLVRAPVQAARTESPSFVIDNAGYVVGGNGTIATVEKLDTSTNTWSFVASINTARGSDAGFSANNLGYIAGGFSGSGLSTVEEYNALSNNWKAGKASISSARYNSNNGGNSLNNIGYTVGGTTDGTTPLSTVQNYKNFNYYNLGVLSDSASTLSSLYVSTILSKLTSSVPVQVRTNGDSWNNLPSNSSSILKNGESIGIKFLPSNLLYTLGGQNGGGLQSVELYSDTANTWTNRQSFGTSGRGYGYGMTLDGNGYYAGGNGAAYYTLNDKYDEVANTWSSKAALGSAIANGGSFSLNNLGYIAGGDQNGSPNNVATVQQYNSASDSWSTKTSLSTSRRGNCAFTILGLGYTTGGVAGTELNVTEQYSDITNAWTTLATLTTAEDQAGGFSLNGYGYVIGGFNGSTQVSTNYKYDPQANSWSTKSSLPAARNGLAGSRFNGYGYSLAGTPDGSTATNTAAQYNDASDSWASITSMNSTRIVGQGSGGFQPGAYRNYELRVGVPGFYAGIGSLLWKTKSGTINATAYDLGRFDLNDSVYRVSGFNGSSNNTSVDKYSSALDSWIASVPVTDGGRNTYGSFSLKGYGYYFQGGSTSGASKFDDQAKTWGSVASLSANAQAVGLALNGYGYALVGSSNQNQRYDQALNTWTAKTNIGTTRNSPAAFSLIGFGYIMSGESQYNCFKYDDASDSWTSVTNTNSPTSLNAYFEIGDRGIYAGGTTNGGSDLGSTNCEEYNPVANIWAVKSGLPAKQEAMGSGFSGGSGYSFGGTGNGSTTTVTYQLSSSIKEVILSAGLKIS